MNLLNKKILVVGLAKTGFSVARFCRHKGAMVTVTDQSDAVGPEEFPRALKAMGVKLELGEHRVSSFKRADLIIISPGVSQTLPPLETARKRKIPIWSEIELAARFIQEPMVAVTGTNGKTTTTMLIGQMLENADLKVFVGGNIGTPLVDYTYREEKADVVVVEVSSFQLDTIDAFRPNVGILLNITEDHQDRYSDFDAYIKSKARIFENQKKGDYAIFNGADPRVRSTIGKIKGSKLPFFIGTSGHMDIKTGAKLNSLTLTIRLQGCDPQSVDLTDLKLPGLHNRENVAAAGLAALCVGGTIDGVYTTVKSFEGLPHRVEFVGTIDGVRYFNDSKATNVDAVIKALACFSSPLVLILCGRNKGGNFALLEKSLGKNIKNIIVFGEAKKDIQNILGGKAPVKLVSNMAEAVAEARNSVESGGVVLLSPGCASFDMYESYSQRGDDFIAVVRQHGKVR